MMLSKNLQIMLSVTTFLAKMSDGMRPRSRAMTFYGKARPLLQELATECSGAENLSGLGALEEAKENSLMEIDQLTGSSGTGTSETIEAVLPDPKLDSDSSDFPYNLEPEDDFLDSEGKAFEAAFAKELNNADMGKTEEDRSKWAAKGAHDEIKQMMAEDINWLGTNLKIVEKKSPHMLKGWQTRELHCFLHKTEKDYVIGWKKTGETELRFIRVKEITDIRPKGSKGQFVVTAIDPKTEKKKGGPETRDYLFRCGKGTNLTRAIKHLRAFWSKVIGMKKLETKYSAKKVGPTILINEEDAILQLNPMVFNTSGGTL